jgi:hypothetical protein
MCLTSETSDFGKATEEGLEILSKYGFDIPQSPTKTVMAKEEMKYKLALRNRSISYLTTLPIQDDSLLALCQQLNYCALCKFMVCSSLEGYACARLTFLHFYLHTYRFWKVGRHEANEFEDNPVCFEEG